MAITWKPSCNGFIVTGCWEHYSVIKYPAFATETFDFQGAVEEQNCGKVVTYINMFEQKDKG